MNEDTVLSGILAAREQREKNSDNLLVICKPPGSLYGETIQSIRVSIATPLS